MPDHPGQSETPDLPPPIRAYLAALTRRLKDSFDPKGVLNPGRMHADV